jgi:endonuclease YncB( thermonuclease family)
MMQNMANLVSSVKQAQSRIRDTTPRTAEWREAQRTAMQARVNYWNEMCLDWDLRYLKRTAGAELSKGL